MIAGQFRYALRTLRRSPGFTITAVSVLALAIGANAAIFSVVYAVILKPLPYPDPSRLVFVWQRFPNMPAPFSERMFVARRNYEEWQRQNTVFQEMAAYSLKALRGASDDPPGKVSTCFATASLFHLLGAEARIGRTFGVEDEHQRRPEAVLTDAFFDRRFHRDRKILGRSVTLDGKTYTVIGVLPPGFHMPLTFFDDGDPDLFVPSPPDAAQQNEVVARLRPGVSVAQARAGMAVLAQRLQNTNREFFESRSTSVFPFSVEESDPELNRALYVLLAAVALLLLIACANLANLTLARALARSRDLTVRLALGATRARIAGQLVSESLLIGIGGAVCGLLLAHWSVKLMLALKPPDIHRPELIALNVPVLAFSAAAASLAAVLFGVTPALVLSRADLASRLKSGGGWGASAARYRSRQILIGSEVALALMLLVGALLMIRSLRQIASVGVGFDTTHLVALDLNLSEKRYPDPAARARLLSDLIGRERTISGVAEAAATTALPLHTVGVSNFHITGRPEPRADASPIADIAQVSPGYFRVLGLPLEAGRWLTDADAASRRYVIVNRAFVAKYFPGENPLGRQLQSGDRKETWQIAGVVSDYQPMGAENGPHAEIFRSSLDAPTATLVVRARGNPQSIEQAVLETARSLAPDLPDDKVKDVAEYAGYWTAQRRFNTLLLAMFAALALVLAALGTYGVLSNTVASRTREIGIRMAVGATSGAIGRSLLWQGMMPVAVGLAAGLGFSLLLGRLLDPLLFHVSARDPLTLAVSASAILLIAPLALCLPVRRATLVDCNIALRDE